MGADEILSRSSQVEKIDNVARRTFGLDTPAAGCNLQLNVLAGRGRTLIAIASENAPITPDNGLKSISGHSEQVTHDAQDNA